MQLEVIIHARWNKWSKQFDYSTQPIDMTEYGYIVLETRTLEFESPTEKQLKVRATTALRAQKSAVLAKAMLEANEIEQEITELLAIEHKPEE